MPDLPGNALRHGFSPCVFPAQRPAPPWPLTGMGFFRALGLAKLVLASRNVEMAALLVGLTLVLLEMQNPNGQRFVRPLAVDRGGCQRPAPPPGR